MSVFRIVLFMNKRLIQNKWSVFKENHSTAHICVLIIAVNVVFILCSTALISILPENRGRSLFETIRLAFTLMVNPSGKYTYSEAPISLIITTIVVLMGMISLTGGTVGFITSVINSFLEKTANSKRSLKLKDHIVILNFNQRVPAVLSDYCFDDEDSTYIVIMTEQDKDSVSKIIDEMYNQLGMKKRFNNVIVRTGNPMSKLDLDRISLSEAKTVILMTPDGSIKSSFESMEEAGFTVSKLFMFVTGYLGAQTNQNNTNIIVETSSENMDKMIQDYRRIDTNRQIAAVQFNKIVGKILGVTAIMPTTNDVLRQLFSFEGTEVYTRTPPSNLTIHDELKLNRSVLPLFDKNGLRIYIAENENEFSKTRPSEYKLKKALPKEELLPCLTFPKSEIVIVGVNSKLPFILESLCCFKKEYNNTQLHVILADTIEKAGDLQLIYENPNYADVLMPDKYQPVIIQNLFRPMDELKDIVNNSADTLLFLSDDTSDSKIDEKPLLYWTDIQHKMASNNNPDIVVEIREAENQNIIKRKNKDQILVSDDFLGHLYAQLGKNPLRVDVIMDLITSEGDTSSVNAANDIQNEGDLLCINVGDFFADKDFDLTFESKRELILWIYEATNKKVLPIGCAKNGVSYLFARTDTDDDGLDSSVLLGINENQRLTFPDGRITLNQEDDLIACILS